jgi:hypothetical protein
MNIFFNQRLIERRREKEKEKESKKEKERVSFLKKWIYFVLLDWCSFFRKHTKLILSQLISILSIFSSLLIFLRYM